MNPKYPVKDVILGDMTYEADFERMAAEMPEHLSICLPDPSVIRTCIMRGHDGSYHSEDTSTARRHNAFHDMEAITAPRNVCNMYGEPGEFKVTSNGHNGMVIDANRYDYFLKTHYIDKQLGGLVQKAFVGNTSNRAADYTKPTPPKWWQPEIHTSWLQTIARHWRSEKGGNYEVAHNELVSDGQQYLSGVKNGTFGKNKFFEMAVDFSRMYAGGHRHSWWWMPVKPNTAYDSIKTNGTEIDGYEHEVNNNEEFSQKLFMKCLGGSIGNTINEIRSHWVSIERTKSWRHGAIHQKGVNDGVQIFGLIWEQSDDGFNSRVRWFRNGVEVVRDSELAPIDVMMYMILSREVNVDHGLSGQNIYDYIENLAEDICLTKYVRSWDIMNPFGVDKSLKNTEETIVFRDIIQDDGKNEISSSLEPEDIKMKGRISHVGQNDINPTSRLADSVDGLTEAINSLKDRL